MRLLLLIIAASLNCLADDVDDYVETQMKERSIPGLSLVVLQSSNIVKTAAYGLANIELQVRATPETVFEIGSITKQFTASLILQLTDVDDEISRHLDDLPESWRAITIRHLLTHTSGIRNYTGLNGFEVRKKLDCAGFIRTLGPYEMDFKPGEKYAYCNSGYNLLGYIIEKTEGTNYWHVLRERILTPLNMRETRDRDTKPLIPNRASGYELEKGEWVNRDSDLTDIFAAGAMVSTARDLAKWELALQRGQILNATNRAMAWTPVKLNSGETYPYGFGWRLDDFEGRRCIGHSGSTSGFSASLQRFPDDKQLAVIVLCNLGQQGLATQVARGVARIYLKN